MNKLFLNVRFRLAPTSSQAPQLQLQARLHERAQLHAQQPDAPGFSLAARIECGELSIEAGRDWLAAQPELEAAAPALLLAALQDLLVRRARAAVAVAQGMPLPPVVQIRGTGLIHPSIQGVQVRGCSGLIRTQDDELPTWAQTAGDASEISRIFPAEGSWWLEVVRASNC